VNRQLSFGIAIVCSVAGCSSTNKEPSTESRNAESAIRRAENEGAKENASGDLEAAKEQLAAGRLAEDAALRDRKSAHADLMAAQKREERARSRIALRNASLAQAEDDRKTQLLALDATSTRAEELREKGVKEEEISTLIDPQAKMLKIHIKSLEQDIEAMKKDIAAMEAVRRDAALEIAMARARLKTAEERLTAARANYVRAEERANLARANSLDARRARLAEQISDTSP